MKVESEQLLSDLVDGERVNPDALAAVLREPGASEVLVEYARIHQAVMDGGEEPSATFYKNVRAELSAPRRAHLEWRRLAAAAALVVSTLGGAWIGRVTFQPRTVSVPQVVRVPVESSPVTITKPAPTPAATSTCAPLGPPKPDRVVLLTVSSSSAS
ncbi:MAG: hypothetical protein ACM3NQ_16510, partial [Bacteroidales bacterium]